MRKLGIILMSKELYDDIWGPKPIVVGNEKLREQIKIIFKEDVEDPVCDMVKVIAECDMFESVSSSACPQEIPSYTFKAGKDGLEQVIKVVEGDK